MNPNDNSPFNKLPKDVKVLIFSKLQYEDFNNISRVNKSWHDASNHINTLKGIYKNGGVNKEQASKLFEKLLNKAVESGQLPLEKLADIFYYTNQSINTILDHLEIKGTSAKLKKNIQKGIPVNKQEINDNIKNLEGNIKNSPNNKKLFEYAREEFLNLAENYPLVCTFLIWDNEKYSYALQNNSISLKHNVDFLKLARDGEDIDFIEFMDKELTPEQKTKIGDFAFKLGFIDQHYLMVLKEAVKDINQSNNELLEDNIELLHYFNIPELLKTELIEIYNERITKKELLDEVELLIKEKDDLIKQEKDIQEHEKRLAGFRRMFEVESDAVLSEVVRVAKAIFKQDEAINERIEKFKDKQTFNLEDMLDYIDIRHEMAFKIIRLDPDIENSPEVKNVAYQLLLSNYKKECPAIEQQIEILADLFNGNLNRELNALYDNADQALDDDSIQDNRSRSLTP